MAKRKSTKPQGTFTSEDVTQLYLRLWALGDAIAAGNLRKVDDLLLHAFGCIPDTTTNDGARTRARNIRQKVNAAKKEARQQAEVNKQDDLNQLRALWGDE